MLGMYEEFLWIINLLDDWAVVIVHLEIETCVDLLTTCLFFLGSYTTAEFLVEKIDAELNSKSLHIEKCDKKIEKLSHTIQHTWNLFCPT